MKDLVKKEFGDDAYSRILRYMQYPEDISLTSKEENILFRWMYCHTLLKARKLRTDDVIDKVAQKFGVSKFTARNDIGFCTTLFYETTQISKEYLLHNHIEDLGLTIEKWKLDKSLAPFVPKLMHEYTVAITHLPESINKKEKPKVINNFFVVQGQNLETPMDYEEALRAADEMIDQEAKEPDKDYSDFEDVTDEDNA